MQRSEVGPVFLLNGIRFPKYEANEFILSIYFANDDLTME